MIVDRSVVLAVNLRHIEAEMGPWWRDDAEDPEIVDALLCQIWDRWTALCREWVICHGDVADYLRGKADRSDVQILAPEYV